ncbi:MAG: Cna B-type domain-containing protein [Anaerolineaceae bacterium]|nr:Cna B-type domain-containing protein [Anaerolineaceae bacterium]
MNKSTVNRILSQLLILSMVLEILPLNFVSVFAQETQQPEPVQTEPAPGEQPSDDGWTVMTSQPYHAPDSYTVTFVQENGESRGEHVQRGSSVGELPKADEIPGAAFSGWYVGDTAIDSAYIPKSDVTALARYISTDTAVFNLSTSNETATVHLIAADPSKANLPANARITTDWHLFDSIAPETPLTVDAAAAPLTREIFGMTLGLSDKYWSFDGAFRVSVVLNSLADPALGPDETLMLTDSAGEEIPADFWFSEEPENKGKLWKIEFTDDDLGDYRILGVTAPKVVREYTVEFLVSEEQNGPETLTLEKRAVRDGEELGDLPEAPVWDTDEFCFAAWQDGKGEPVSAETIVKKDMAITAVYAPVFRGSADNGVSVVIEAPLGALPEGAVFEISSADAEQYRGTIETNTGKTYAFLQAIDMGFALNGEKVRPQEPVTVTLNVTGVENADTILVWHVAEDGSIENVPLTVGIDEILPDAAPLRSPMLKSRGIPAAPVTTVSFRTAGFSPFLLTAGGTSSAESNDLNQFLTDIHVVKINDQEIPESERADYPIAGRPGDTMTLRLFFHENEANGDIDCSDDAVLYFDLPVGFTIDPGYSTFAYVDVNLLGKEIVIPNNPVHCVAAYPDPDYLEMTWDFRGISAADLRDFRSSGDIWFYIDVIGTIIETPVTFGPQISVVPPSDPRVDKYMDPKKYDKENHTIEFLVVVEAADGDVSKDYPILVQDTLGEAYSFVSGTFTYSHGENFSLTENYDPPKINGIAETGNFSFPATISHLYAGDSVSFKYTVELDYDKIPVLGSESSATTNTAALYGMNGEPYYRVNPGDKKGDDSKVISAIYDISDMHKKSGNVTRHVEGTTIYVDVPWTITFNDLLEFTMDGETIRDEMTYDPGKTTMALLGDGFSVKVIDENGDTAKEYTIPWISVNPVNDDATGKLSWEWLISEEIPGKYKYEVTYSTRSKYINESSMVYNRASGKIGSARAYATIAVDGDGHVEIQKSLVKTNSRQTTWEVKLLADARGYSSCVLTDTLPGDRWVNGKLYKDSGFEITGVIGLYEGESYQYTYNDSDRLYDKVELHFYQDGGTEGLLPAAPADILTKTIGTGANAREWQYREITMTIVTDINQEWISIPYVSEYAGKHINKVDVLANFSTRAEANASVTPLLPTIFKVTVSNDNAPAGSPRGTYKRNDGLDYPYYEFRVFIGGLNDDLLEDGKVIIEDQFDVEYPELWQLYNYNSDDPSQNWKDNNAWSNARFYVCPTSSWPNEANGGYLVWRSGMSARNLKDMTMPGQDADGSMGKITAYDNGNGTATFVLENLPKRNGEYWETYQILYRVVPKDPAALEKLDRLALAGESGGSRQFENTVWWNKADLSASSVYLHNKLIMTKKITEVSGNWVNYEININPGGLRVNNGRPLTLIDDIRPDKATDPNTGETIYTCAEQAIDYGSIFSSVSNVSWDYSGYVGTFQIPDGVPVTITYRTRVTGVMDQTVTYKNKAVLTNGEQILAEASQHGDYTLTSDNTPSSGSAGLYGIKLFKYSENHMEDGLAGAEFRLLDANKRPMHYPAGHEKAGQEIIFTTGDDGYVWILLRQNTDGLTLKKNTVYYLEEVKAPVVINADGSIDTYQKDNTYYSFRIKTDPAYQSSDGIYTYYNGDIMKIRNYPAQKNGINISKRFTGNVTWPEPADSEQDLKFKLEKINSYGTTDETWTKVFTYSDIKKAYGTYHIDLTGLQTGDKLRITEENDSYPDSSENVSHQKTYTISRYNGTEVEETSTAPNATCMDFELTENDSEHSIDILVTNEYTKNTFEIKKVNKQGTALPGAVFTVKKAAGDSVVTSYTSSDTGIVTIGWDSEKYSDDGTLYYVTETTAPGAQYLLPENPERFYFYFSSGDAPAQQPPAGYSAVNLSKTFDSVVVENNTVKVDISVTKVWGVNGDEAWPENVGSVTVRLLQSVDGSDPEPVPAAEGNLTAALNSSKKSHTFTRMPAIDEQGRLITYSVEETINFKDGQPQTDYRSSVEKDDDYTFLIKNVPNQQKLTVKKVWNDAAAPANTRPETVTVSLLKNGTKQDEFTLSDANQWTAEKDVEMYDDEDNLIEYTWEETDLPSNYRSRTTVSGALTTITNTYNSNVQLITVSGNKTWIDEDNAANTRPGSIKINLVKRTSQVVDGVETVSDEELDSLTVRPDANGEWKWEFVNLPQITEANVSYAIKEDPVPNYQAAYDGYNVTNTYAPEMAVITLTKIWSDGGNNPSSWNRRPASVAFRAYADNAATDKTYTLTSADAVPGNVSRWTKTITDLPKYRKNSTAAIRYTFKEEPVPPYYISGTVGNTITNTAVKTLRITKVWQDSDAQYKTPPASVQVKLLADGTDSGKNVTLSAANGWTAEIPNMPVFKNNAVITYTWQEIDPPGEYIAVYSDPVTAFENNVLYESTTLTNKLDLVDLTVKKVWIDENDQDGRRPGSITVTLKNGSQTIGSYTLNQANQWTSPTVTKLKNDANGNLIAYTWTETRIPGYNWPFGESTSITEVENGPDKRVTTLTNKHDPATVELTVKKVWDDAGNSDADSSANIRPAFVTVQLVAKTGDSEYEPVEGHEHVLNAANNWTLTVSGLNKFKEGAVGQEITYDWVEKAVSDGYKLEKDVDHSVTTLTNIRTTEATVKKVWNDANNKDGKRPDSLTVNLKSKVGSDESDIQTVTLNEGNNWTATITELPKYNGNEKIEYTWTEDVPDGYKLSASLDDSGTVTTLTNTFVTEAGVHKVWNDAENIEEKRPKTLKVTLSAKAGSAPAEDVDSVTLSSSNGWTAAVTGLPKYSGNDEIIYSWTEEQLPEGYELTGTSKEGTITTLTNTLVTKALVIKVWDDAENQDGLITENTALTLQLLADGAPVEGKTLTLRSSQTDAAGNWIGSIEGLPKYSGDRTTRIVYTWTETNLPADYALTNTETDSTGYITTLTNSHTPYTKTVPVKKIWDDADDQDGLRPADSITVTLAYKADNSEIASVELTKANGWSGVFTVPVNKAGSQIVYNDTDFIINETGVPAEYQQTALSYSETEGYSVTNTHSPYTQEIDVMKVWDDAGNQDGIRPEEITLSLTDKAGHLISLSPVTLTETSLAGKFHVPVNKNGQPISYNAEDFSVAETNVPEQYQQSVVYSETGGYEVTNSYTPETAVLTVVKSWDDAEDQDGIRPESVDVILSGKTETESIREETMTLTEEGKWTASVKVPVKNDGKVIQYTWTESGIEGLSGLGYSHDPSADVKTEVTAEGSVTTITNHHKPDTTDLTIVKKWDDGYNQDGIRPQSLNVTLSKEAAGVVSVVKTITLNEANKWTAEENDLPVNEKGSPVTYSWSEAAVGGYELTETKVEENVTTLTNTHKPLTTTASGSKYWSDDNDRDGIRPETVTVQLLANGIPVEGKTAAVGEAENWTWKFDELPMYQNGQPVTYTVSEEAVEGYAASYNGMNITNLHVPGTVSVSGQKTWDDADDQDGKRPESITVQLLSNGTPVAGQSVTVSETEGWKWTFNNLPKNDAGTEIVYSVSETPVEGYTAEIDGMNITNKHVPETVDLTIRKVWVENGSSSHPASLNMVLVGGKQSRVVTLSDENDWTAEVSGLPVYEAGTKIEYSWQEPAVNGYTRTSLVTEGNVTTITNKANETPTVTVTVTETATPTAVTPTEVTPTPVTPTPVTPTSPAPTDPAPSEPERPEPSDPGEPEPTVTPYRPYYPGPVRTPAAPTSEPTAEPTKPVRERITPTPAPTEGPEITEVVPTDVPTTVPTPEPRTVKPVEKSGDGPEGPLSPEEMTKIIRDLEKKYKIVLPTIFIDDFGTPLGLGNVFINVGDCLE